MEPCHDDTLTGRDEPSLNLPCGPWRAGMVPALLQRVEGLTKVGNYIVASRKTFSRDWPVSCRAPPDTDFEVMQSSRGWRWYELSYAMKRLLTHR